MADASDDAALAEMAESTRVVISTVGPYALYGSPLVAAVSSAGTDYCDLTGETQWIRQMIDAHQGDAEASGARVLNACGCWLGAEGRARHRTSPSAASRGRVPGGRRAPKAG